MPQRVVRHSPLAGLQRAATKALTAMRQEITQRERDLAALKTEAARWQSLLQGAASGRGPVSPPRKRFSRQPRLDWSTILQELPARFTVRDIVQKTSKPIAHAYTYVSRWMKEKKVRRVKDGYQKV